MTLQAAEYREVIFEGMDAFGFPRPLWARYYGHLPDGGHTYKYLGFKDGSRLRIKRGGPVVVLAPRGNNRRKEI